MATDGHGIWVQAIDKQRGGGGVCVEEGEQVASSSKLKLRASTIMGEWTRQDEGSERVRAGDPRSFEVQSRNGIIGPPYYYICLDPYSLGWYWMNENG